jgi:thioredoxin-related protein
MESQAIKWGSDLGRAKEEAMRSGKLILFFFHSKTCNGCQATIAKVLPDTNVSRQINSDFAPLMFEVSEPASQDLMKRYEVQWTPTFVVADKNGDVVDRWVGFLPVEDYRAHLTMAEAKAAFKKNDFDRAYKCYNAVTENFPKSDLAPEALYYRGVSLYKKSEDPSYLKKTNDELKSRYPDNIWAKKASVWGQ